MIVLPLLCNYTHPFNSIVMRYPPYSSQHLLLDHYIVSFLSMFSLHYSINIDCLKLYD